MFRETSKSSMSPVIAIGISIYMCTALTLGACSWAALRGSPRTQCASRRGPGPCGPMRGYARMFCMRKLDERREQECMH
jgi:hypothetical protein